MSLLDWVKVKGCLCGKNHSLNIAVLKLEQNILTTVEDTIENVMFQFYGERMPLDYSILMICDENTYISAGKKIEEFMIGKPFNLIQCRFNSKGILIPDESSVAKIEESMQFNTRILLAVGSGTINDLTRYTAYKHKIPYIAFPTAPSVDGYASSVSSLIVKNIKKTFAAKPPDAIIADSKIMQKSPPRLKSAGFGDLLGKFTARLDWHLGNIIYEEYFCTVVADKVIQKVNETIENFDTKKLYNNTFITHLTEALLVSGLAISMVGSSRPASGSEHHISHFLERKIIEGRIKQLYHGETVAIGTFLVSNLYDLVFDHTYREFHKIIRSKPDKDSKKARIERFTQAFGSESEIFIDNWVSKRQDSNQTKELQKILKSNWNKLTKLKFDILGSADRVEKLMKKAKIPYNPKKIGIPNVIIENAIICSKEMRSRFTILTLLDELGVLEYFCSRLLDEKL